jgi:hypothetical protein
VRVYVSAVGMSGATPDAPTVAPPEKGRLPRQFWPEYLTAEIASERLKGIFLGGCVLSGRSFCTHREHAHFGWICLRSPGLIHDCGLIVHELAHVLTGDGHTDAWWSRCADLARRIGLDLAHVARPDRLSLRKRTTDHDAQ